MATPLTRNAGVGFAASWSPSPQVAASARRALVDRLKKRAPFVASSAPSL
jgi:hypothetical protein